MSKKEKITILIADDNPIVLKMLRKVIEHEGEHIQCISVVNGKQAWITYQQCDIDLVITDYDMPVMNGYELLEKIKAQDPHANVIMLTAEQNDELQEQSLIAGARAFFRKPDDVKELLVTIKEQTEAYIRNSQEEEE